MEEHKPTGCNMVHPFTLRPDVEWANEGNAFSTPKWEYTDSQVKHTELRRFQYSDLVGLVIPIQLAIGCVMYPLLFYSLDFAFPYMYLFLLMGIVWMVLLPLAIFAHAKRSWEFSWIKAKIAVDYFLLATCMLATGYWEFLSYWEDCSHRDSDDISFWIGRSLSNTTGYGWTPERQAVYCQQIIYPFAFFTLIYIPLTMNLPPISIGVFLFLRALAEIVNRPIFDAMEKYDAPDPTGRLISFLLVLIFGCGLGILLYVKQQGSTRDAFTQAVTLATEIQEAKSKEEHVDLLLSATVPPSALIRLSKNEAVSDSTPSATVLFSDMVHFTEWSSSRTPQQVVTMLNIVTEAIDREASRMNVEKIKTIGDAYWAVTGLPEEMDDHASTMCQFGLKMLCVVAESSRKHPEWGSVQFRIGIHSGPLNGGILGTTMISYEVFGETSDIAAMVEQAGVPNRVVVTQEAATQAEIEPTTLEQRNATVECNGRTYQLFTLDQGTVSLNSQSRSASVSSVTASLASQQTSSSVHMGQYGKQRRKAFLQQRAMAQAAKAEADLRYSINTTFEADVRQQYTKLKWRWLISTFADPEAESAFGLFALQKQKEKRLLSRLVLLAFPLLLLLGSAIEQSTPGTPPISAGMIVCSVLGMISGAVDVVLLYWTSYRNSGGEWPVLQLILSFVTVILLILAGAFANPGSSVMTNDPSWMVHPLSLLTMLGNSGVIQTLWLMLIYIFVMWPIMFVSTYHTYNYGEHRTMEAQLWLAVGFLLAVSERRLRQHFADLKLQQYFQREQLHRIAEQDALLKSIVPEHISGALLMWMSGDMKLPLVRNYSNCAVAFMRLQPPQAPAGDVNQGRARRSATPLMVDDLESNDNPRSPQDQRGTIKSDVVVDDVESDTELEVDKGTAAGNPFLSIVPGEEGDPVFVGAAAAEKVHWQAESITKVDVLLSHNRYISKIKTIGDVVMLAGPFIPEFQAQKQGPFESVRDLTTTPSELQNAIMELVELAQLLKNIGGGAHVGIHCGPLVGAIQGTNRLCFDVFGDTVNVASRCMTGGAEKVTSGSGDLCVVSQEARGAMGDRAEGFVFQERTVSAKGKGLLTVFLVSSVHHQCIM